MSVSLFGQIPPRGQVVRFGAAADPKVLKAPMASELTTTLVQAGTYGANTTASQVPALVNVLGQLGNLASRIPQGKIEAKGGNVIITSWAEGKPVEVKFPEGRRAIVRGPETSVQDFLREVAGGEPALVIGPIGWTIPNPDTVAEYNPTIYQQFQALEKTLSGDALTKAKKEAIAKLYENAFDQWWEPIQRNLNRLIEEKKLPKNRIIMLTSASNSGIDRAAMRFADKNGITVANITPYVYAQWMDTSKTYPLLVTNTVDDYAQAYAEGADLVVLTGGRDHALKKDVALGLLGNYNIVVPADVLREEVGITVPSTLKGKVENAAAFMQKRGLNVAGMEIAESPRLLPGLRASQAHTVAALERLFNQKVLPSLNMQG